MKKIEVHVLQGAMPSSVALTADVLTTANLLRAARSQRGPFQLRLSGSGSEPWRALLADQEQGFDGQADLVILPGLGLSNPQAVSGRLGQEDVLQAQSLARAALDRNAEVATSCSGVFVLAAAGLLNGRTATTSWFLAPVFAQLFPDVGLQMDQLIVHDGPITTAGASLAQMDLMLSLVARFGGPELAADCSRHLLLDQRRSQARYMALSFLAATDERVAKAEAFARQRLAEDLNVQMLADVAGLTPRTFARRVERVTGLSPIRFLQRLRIEAATELLESTKLPIDEIARQVGYADPSALRRIMQREGNMRPGALRPRSQPS